MIADILKNIIIGAPGSYNMLSLEIEIGGKTSFERSPTVFHEYTHYLQNMTTINGFSSLNKYFHVLLVSFTKLGTDPYDPTLPLCNYLELQSVLGDKNIENIQRRRFWGMDIDNITNKFVFQKTDLDDYIITEKKCIDNYSGLTFTIPYIALDGENIPINETIIKENMSLVNSIIGSHGNDILSEEDIKQILEYEHLEYIVLFDFINHYLPNHNLLKLIYCICEIGLNTTEEIFGFVLRLIQEKADKFSKIGTENVIILLREMIKYDEIINKLFSLIFTKDIPKTIALFNSFDFSTNQFVGIMYNFYNFLINGVKYRETQKTLYIDHLTNEYIQNLTAVIGCPIIYFKEDNEYKNISNTPEYFFTDFAYLHGTLKLFTILYTSNITSCPFSNGNICQVQRNEKCNHDCLQNYYNDVYKNCLLSNALNCSGIRKENR